MAAKKVRVTYLDGREEEVKVSPRATVMAEEHCGGLKDKNALLFTYYVGWAALHKAGKEAADFETWLDTIEDVENIVEDVPPTPPAQSGDTSSD